MAFSDDAGVTWTTAAIPLSAVNGLVFGGSKFVAVGVDGGVNKAMSSWKLVGYGYFTWFCLCIPSPMGIQCMSLSAISTLPTGQAAWKLDFGSSRWAGMPPSKFVAVVWRPLKTASPGQTQHHYLEPGFLLLMETELSSRLITLQLIGPCPLRTALTGLDGSGLLDELAP